jgi:protein TonB
MCTSELTRRIMRSSTTYWELNARYVRYCLIALVLSMIGHAVYLAYGPAVEAKPYKLVGGIIEVIDIPDVIDVPKPPPPVEQPKLPADIETSDVLDDDDVEDIASSEYPGFDWTPPPIVKDEPDFYAYDTKPKLIKLQRPRYPELARQAHAEGNVYVQVTIDEMGRVIEAVVVQSNAIESLDDAALEAARKCLFKPALQRDVPVKSRVILPFKFRLN